MSQHNAAYDFSVFENRPVQNQGYRMEVRHGSNNRRQKQRMMQLASLAAAVVMLALVAGLLASQAALTEMTTQVQRLNREITEAVSEYDYLNSVMDSKTSVKNVEEIARSQLGLVKLDKSQITYVTLEEESVITVPRSGLQRKVDHLQNGLLNVKDHLNP